MSENPIINALSATLYISLIGSLMFYGKNLFGPVDTVAAPIGMLSLLVLSAGIMAYIFFYKPIQLLIEGRKVESIDLFLKTIGVFAIITLLVFSTLFFSAR